MAGGSREGGPRQPEWAATSCDSHGRKFPAVGWRGGEAGELLVVVCGEGWLAGGGRWQSEEAQTAASRWRAEGWSVAVCCRRQGGR